MVKSLPEFEYFTVFLKNKNIIFKIRRSKVTDYAALKYGIYKPRKVKNNIKKLVIVHSFLYMIIHPPLFINPIF